VHAGICAGGSPSSQGEGLSLPRLLDLDIRAFFDRVPWDLVLKAVAHHTDQRWILLYVERWLKAPLQREDGSLVERDRGTPQGSAMTAPTQKVTSSLSARFRGQREGIGREAWYSSG
jgi:retron-type reverse transcriptase